MTATTEAADTLTRYPSVDVFAGDALDILRQLPDGLADAVVTDPPYGLSDLKPKVVTTAITAWTSGDREHVPDGRGFMGRKWDAFVPPPAVFDECLRVLKPGGHLLCFAGTRTVDLMGLSIRLAGFEIRDTIGNASGLIAWVYGSGFPKSLNVSRDARFCQCVSSVRDATTEDAAESAAEVLLADVHGYSPDEATSRTDLHGLSVDVHPDHAIPGRAEQDVLGGMHAGETVRGDEGAPVDPERADHSTVRSVLNAGDAVAEQGAAEPSHVLLAELPGEGERSDATGQRLRRDRDEAAAALRGGQPGLEGRGDVQAGEGQLRRPEVRPLPAGPDGDGAVGRLRDGAPTGDGPLGRPAAAPDRVREPRRPESSEQRPGEPGAVSDERGPQAGRGWPVCGGCGKQRVLGVGTALKPAWEPILVARKPLVGTVAANVVEHGTGGLNIDACRVHGPDAQAGRKRHGGGSAVSGSMSGPLNPDVRPESPAGRWPANVVLSHAYDCGSDEPCELHGIRRCTICLPEFGCATGCPVAELDAQSGNRPGSHAQVRHADHVGDDGGTYGAGLGARAGTHNGFGDSGGASRFFPTFRYQAKAPTRERPKVDGKGHPTVKPLELMRWLVRLITPPGGTVLDPFAGSGTTGQAAALEGMLAILIDREPEWIHARFETIA